MWLIWWRLLGCHVSIYIHNISWRYFKKHARFWRLLGSRHFRYIVLTEEIANTLNSAGLPASRLNNTLTDGDEPVALASRIPVKRLLWMSAVTAEKGFIVAYDTFLTLRAKDPAWHLDVYGAGLLAGNTDRFTYANFHGFTHGTKKQAALDAGGIFILPSHYINETQPLSIIEALANGIPFVASTIGGIKAMQGSGSSSLAGVCLEASSPVSDWVEAVEAVYDNYEAFSRAAITTYKTDFSRAAYRAGVSRLIDKSLN
ncbi:MAG: glycosyltransferase family 4 protein [Verrucomicrobia bacterium]|nr:glycosyltransferase family 4 protein [Verrucomicrobiota bacterium]